MKAIVSLLACALILLCAPGCGKPATLKSVHATRLTDESAEAYQSEDGTFSDNGFVTSTVSKLKYSQGGCTRPEVQKVSGKPITPLAYWNGIEKYTRLTRSKDTFTIGGVPYVVLER